MVRKEYVVNAGGKLSTHADIYLDDAGNMVMNILLVDGENEEVLSTSNTYDSSIVLTEEELDIINGVASV